VFYRDNLAKASLNFNKAFIYFDPKDLVRGDFYWASFIQHQKNDLFIYITADCNAHGLPGAFMSLISISFLNEIINEKNIRRRTNFKFFTRKNNSNSKQ